MLRSALCAFAVAFFALINHGTSAHLIHPYIVTSKTTTTGHVECTFEFGNNVGINSLARSIQVEDKGRLSNAFTPSKMVCNTTNDDQISRERLRISFCTHVVCLFSPEQRQPNLVFLTCFRRLVILDVFSHYYEICSNNTNFLVRKCDCIQFCLLTLYSSRADFPSFGIFFRSAKRGKYITGYENCLCRRVTDVLHSKISHYINERTDYLDANRFDQRNLYPRSSSSGQAIPRNISLSFCNYSLGVKRALLG